MDTMRYLSLLFLLCVGCSTIRQKRLMRHAIIYTVFDSAEKYFVHDIQEHAPEKPIGVIIDPYYDKGDQKIIQLYNYVYRMAVVFKFGDLALQYGAMEKSNRYLKVGNYLLPIYFMYIDDGFLSFYYNGKLHPGWAADTTRTEFGQRIPTIYPQHFILVNINRKTISGAY
jgi:hypothetical protein